VVVLVDTNVVLDVLTDDPRWGDWSQRQLETASLTHRLIINPVVYAELAVGFARIEDLDAVLLTTRLAVDPIPWPALFLAGKVFAAYRRQGGAKSGVLPDFFIGAHAAVLSLPLLTRDATRYVRYFPSVALIKPRA
jgi:predicted nucleic acid-binding protein